MKRLDLIVGPNGAGKSTFVAKTLAQALPPATPFVNADLIAAERWPDEAEARSYEAAQVAAKTREALLDTGMSFVAETVFSHPSKLKLVNHARELGYTVVMHVLMVPEELSVARVRARVSAGGHSVPEEKIRARYTRLWTWVLASAGSCDQVIFYDNSASSGPRIVAQVHLFEPVGTVAWPTWAPDRFQDTWPDT